MVSPDPHGSPSPASATDTFSSRSSINEELSIDVRVLQGGWWQWNEKYHGHPQLFEAIHPIAKSAFPSQYQPPSNLHKN